MSSVQISAGEEAGLIPSGLLHEPVTINGKELKFEHFDDEEGQYFYERFFGHPAAYGQTFGRKLSKRVASRHRSWCFEYVGCKNVFHYSALEIESAFDSFGSRILTYFTELSAHIDWVNIGGYVLFRYKVKHEELTRMFPGIRWIPRSEAISRERNIQYAKQLCSVYHFDDY